MAAGRGRLSVWLVDLDLMASSQYAALNAEAGRYGELGPALAASPDGSIFFTVEPPDAGADGRITPAASYLTAHQVGELNWWVTRFRAEALGGRQTVAISPSRDYWNALRKHADLIIVDCPSADRSDAALTVAPFMDQTVLVVSADEPDVKAPALLRDALVATGADVAGLFFNRAVVEEPPFLKAILP
ncbi:sugar kinase [Phenylobacterium sp.]|uniref:sugar kinase n=1 Tax=Phenylobacterium sp. TaxID=1871053 RepID=UPI0035B458FD